MPRGVGEVCCTVKSLPASSVQRQTWSVVGIGSSCASSFLISTQTRHGGSSTARRAGSAPGTQISGHSHMYEGHNSSRPVISGLFFLEIS